MQVLNADRVDALARAVRTEWDRKLASWPADCEMPLYATTQEVLTRAVCAWSGVALSEQDVAERTAWLVALYDDAARGPLAHLHARRARAQAEAWLCKALERVRAGLARHAADSVLEIVALHRDTQGHLLPLRVAAVELLNLLRPTVAVAVFVMFVAHALHFHTGVRAKLLGGDPAYRTRFLDEVRRYYPFFPAVAAKVREDFTWRGLQFRRGRRVLLDLYGTNHDARIWTRPEEFDPDRFLAKPPTPYEFIPQGGASVATGHRCPGEGVAMAVMDECLDFLLYRAHCGAVPPDPSIDMRRLPALPRAVLTVSARLGTDV